MAKFITVLGSSHKNGIQYIDTAIKMIMGHPRFNFRAACKIYKNSSSGTKYNSLFYNSACAIETALNPKVFYRELMGIEHLLGRIRSYKFSRRTIDIDVLISLDFTFITSNFQLPHREAFNRNFFVIPAIEVLKLAKWPLPMELLKARTKLGRGFLYSVGPEKL